MKATRVCSVESCDRCGKITRGLCDKHYQRARKRGELGPRLALGCSVEGCDRKHSSLGLCYLHYKRMWTHGSLDAPARPSVSERLAAKLVRMSNGCLEWTGGTDQSGYGRIRTGTTKIGTHRLAWELINGPIPDGMCVCHHCDNPLCCDDTHLFLGTHRDNMVDMAVKGRAGGGRDQAAKTHCPQGHPYDETNTYIRPDRSARDCLTCRRIRDAARAAKAH